MKIHKLLLDCPKFNIREEISANLLYEALNGLPENPDERLRQTLDSWCNGTCGEIPDDDLHYVEENLAQTHHGSEHKLGLVGRIAAEDYEGSIGGEMTEKIENIQSGIVLAMALKRFRILCGFNCSVRPVQEDEDSE
ncbi:MAG: hypothetical protein BWK80_49525 [Desulfobacteraceae bacterium IS3]|nr:MAG: hypothetical protein BWK80_49525 [Desulfobacteraceae bacterium IS3]HAO21729.1 hypothetical protein [Desulfobacteraceae bacterium]